MKPSKLMFALCASALSMAAVASEYERPQGFKIGDRLTLKPYVSLSFTYDSNVDSTKHAKSGSNWNIAPGMGLTYAGDNWGLTGSVWYQYHAYNNYSSQLNQSSYGERILFNWKNSAVNEKGGRSRSMSASSRFRRMTTCPTTTDVALAATAASSARKASSSAA